ncbi:hypothetical protein GQ53DRAFT_814292 [Thozetella sp. PMI_491]|nr:hypothetical protein GQ53DRAFT_814292 [Thozetella sp. PMI_491]
MERTQTPQSQSYRGVQDVTPDGQRLPPIDGSNQTPSTSQSSAAKTPGQGVDGIPNKSRKRKFVEKEWTHTHILPSTQQVSGNGRQEGRNLIAWTRPRMAEKLLLHLLYECSRHCVDIPWDAIAHRFHPGSSGSAIVQHLNRVRPALIAEGHLVPPVPLRPGARPQIDPTIRGYVRKYETDSDNLFETRAVPFSEPLDDRRFNLPDAYDSPAVSNAMRTGQTTRLGIPLSTKSTARRTPSNTKRPIKTEDGGSSEGPVTPTKGGNPPGEVAETMQSSGAPAKRRRASAKGKKKMTQEDDSDDTEYTPDNRKTKVVTLTRSRPSRVASRTANYKVTEEDEDDEVQPVRVESNDEVDDNETLIDHVMDDGDGNLSTSKNMDASTTKTNNSPPVKKEDTDEDIDLHDVELEPGYAGNGMPYMGTFSQNAMHHPMDNYGQCDGADHFDTLPMQGYDYDPFGPYSKPGTFSGDYNLNPVFGDSPSHRSASRMLADADEQVFGYLNDNGDSSILD